MPEGASAWTDTEVDLAGPARVSLRAARTGGRGVHVTGELAATLSLECRRCLDEIQEPIRIEIDLLFDPDVPEDAGEERVYPLEADARMLDLAPVLREQLVLEVPAYPICEEDCAGLCPKCGTDLNEETCDCTLVEPDPRWDALRELAENQEVSG